MKISGQYKFFNNQAILLIGITLISVLFSLITSNPVASQDLGKGFYDHGVAISSCNPRGTVATVDGNGRNVVLVWLFDHRGSYALLMIDAESGKSEQFPIPFQIASDAVYASVLSSKNKFYTLFNNHFAEFDPVKKAFTFYKETMPQKAMGMTEDDKGVIWATTYPNSGLVSYNPNTTEFRDFGYLYQQNWPQYPRTIAVDDTGWVYFGLGSTASQIMAFDPSTRQAKPMLNESERKKGYAYVYRDMDGKVYGQSILDKKEDWYEFHSGNRQNIGKHDLMSPTPIVKGSQDLFQGDFPDGKKLKNLDLMKRKLIVVDPKTKTEKEVSFECTNDGTLIMGVITSPDSTIVGGSTFPMRFFKYNPNTNTYADFEAFGQINAMTRQGSRLYFGDYPEGALLELDTSIPWTATTKGAKTNPLFLAEESTLIHRPNRVFAYPDNNTIIMSGSPDYGYTGGGLLFWDRKEKKQTLLKDSSIILNQSTLSLVALPGGKLLGGTTTDPGTGGQKKATDAELYRLDLASKHIEWHKVPMPGVQGYSDMCLGPDGLVYGITDLKKFFVFDPVKHIIIHLEDLESNFGITVGNQSPRIFVLGPKGKIYLLCVKGIVQIDPGSFKLTMIAESPTPISVGGDYLNGRIYFVSGSHLCSYKL